MADTIEVCHAKWTTFLYFRYHKWQIPSRIVMWSRPIIFIFESLNGRYHRSLSCEVDQTWQIPLKFVMWSGPNICIFGTLNGRYHPSLSCEVDQTSLFWRPEMADTIEVCHVKWTKTSLFQDPKWQIPSKFVMWSGPITSMFGTRNGRYHRSLSCEVDQNSVFSGPWMTDTIVDFWLQRLKSVILDDPLSRGPKNRVLRPCQKLFNFFCKFLLQRRFFLQIVDDSLFGGPKM